MKHIDVWAGRFIERAFLRTSHIIEKAFFAWAFAKSWLDTTTELFRCDATYYTGLCSKYL